MIGIHNNFNIILASQSPRRQELLKTAGIVFSVEVRPDLPEDFPDDMPVHEVPEYLALKKLTAYEDTWSKPGNVVITADTIVALDERILNKPCDRGEAIEMLTLLSGKVHEVFTGVVIKSMSKQVSFTAVTHVWFKSLSREEICYYVDNFHPYDKAGAYGIQEWIGLTGIERIEGSYFNVVGLPVDRVYEELAKF